jgi:DNA repair protein RadA/Sms
MRLNTQLQGFKHSTNILSIDIPYQLEQTAKTGISYIDDAFGGKGMTPSVATLMTGTAGSGKTTLMLQLANSLTRQGHVCLFNTAEESLFQIRRTVKRLGLTEGFYAGQDTHVPTILKHCDKIREENPGKQLFFIVDSLQTLDDGHFNSGRITSATSERSLQQITDYCKENWAIALVIGQVNKAGKFSGTSKLKHMVDAHCHLSIETDQRSDNFGYRIFEVQKNRFGGAGHGYVLDMSARGLKEFGTL